MVSRIPPEVEEVFGEFRTCEFSTIAKDGTPITWPAAAFYRSEEATFTLTTSIGLANKAFNVRRNPSVALFFSDPTACGLEDPPFVLVQGDARAPDRIVSVDGLEEYWKILFRRQPASKLYSLPIVRRFADFYYMRLVIEVAIRRVSWWPGGDVSRPPQRMDLAGVD